MGCCGGGDAKKDVAAIEGVHRRLLSRSLRARPAATDYLC
jgi:hypothetical protein